MKLPQRVVQTLAADLAADADQLYSGQVQVVNFRLLQGRRHFPIRTPHLHALSLGKAQGSIISVSSDLLEAAQKIAPRLNQHSDLFSGPGLSMLATLLPTQVLCGPDIKYVCVQPQPGPEPMGYIMQTYDKNISSFASSGCFSHAICGSPDRPNVLAKVALYKGQVAGLAAASADNDSLWQIGIDVLPGHRGRGLAHWLVADLAAAILELGRIPYYSTNPGNIASQRLAVATGFIPAWVEVYGSTCS